VSLGEVYQRQRRWQAAADAYGKAVKQLPGNVELKVRLAFALLSEPDTKEAARARDLLSDALKVSPGDGRTLYLMIQAERLLKDLDGAEATARRLMNVQPGNLWGATALAEVLSDRREYRKVIDTLEPLLSKGPTEKPGTDDAARMVEALTQRPVRSPEASFELARDKQRGGADALSWQEALKAAGQILAEAGEGLSVRAGDTSSPSPLAQAW
jgi:predicted Zn-dependent protease